MEMTVSAEDFCELNDSDLMNCEGGGPAAQFLSIVGIGTSLAVAAVCPPAGILLFGTSLGVYLSNLN